MKPKVLLLALLAQFLTLSASAYDAVVNGIYYNLDINTRTAEVTYKHHGEWDSYGYNINGKYGYYTFYSGSVTIPEQITYNSVTYNVTSIGWMAFYACSSLTTVTIPSSVTSIEKSAFRACSSLLSLTIPPSVVYIGPDALPTPWIDTFLSYQEGLVYINNVLYCYKGTMEENANIVLKEGTTCICACAFQDCANMASIIIPESVAYIGSRAFRGCNSLKEINFPKKLKLLASGGTFAKCISMESIEIPVHDTWTDGIDGAMFEDCIGLKNASFAEGITTVKCYDFFGCTNISYVSFPSTVTEISGQFRTNVNLTIVKAAMKQPVSISESVFPYRSNATLYVPEGCKPVYEEAPFWQSFKEIIEMVPDPDTDISSLDNAIYLYKTDCLAGQELTLSFQMKNTAAIRGFQFDLYLPEGVTAVKNAKGRIQGALSSGRLPEDDEHTLTIQEQADGAIRFLCSSLYDETFTGSEGEIATLQVKIGENMEDGNYPIIIKDMKLTETDISNYYETSYLKSTLTISAYTPGDVNGDTKVDVSDYTGVANHILGIAQEVFIERAGDVDNSGTIDVSDYTGIANFIMTGSFSGRSNLRKAKGLAGGAGENVIYVQDAELPVADASGAEINLSIRMRNTADIRGFQFDMYLPEGFTVVKNNKGRITASLSSGRRPEGDEHTLTVQEQADGAIRFLCSSLYDETFTGTDGDIATVKVKIAENITAGNYPIQLKNIKLTETNISNYYETELMESVFKITGSTTTPIRGDVNEDGRVDIADVVAVLNIMAGN